MSKWVSQHCRQISWLHLKSTHTRSRCLLVGRVVACLPYFRQVKKLQWVMKTHSHTHARLHTKTQTRTHQCSRPQQFSACQQVPSFVAHIPTPSVAALHAHTWKCRCCSKNSALSMITLQNLSTPSARLFLPSLYSPCRSHSYSATSPFCHLLDRTRTNARRLFPSLLPSLFDQRHSACETTAQWNSSSSSEL